MKFASLPLLAFAFVLVFAFLLALPFPASAATKPSCELTVTTPNGSIEIDDRGKILLAEGNELTIAWDSKNAKEAFDDNNDEIDIEGSSTSSPSKNRTYTYRFENGNREVECEVFVQIADGNFKKSTLATKSLRPTLSGTASGTKSVQVAIYKSEGGKPLFISKAIKVKNGKWSTKVTKSLSKRDYAVALLGERRTALNVIATSTLSIGSALKKAKSANTTFVVEPVPLLSGGTAKAGTAIPVSYLQVINIGKAAGKVESFSVKQNGSASTDAIVGFVVSDNRSAAVTSVGSISKPIVFKDGKATIPVSVPIEAGQMRLFTIKAILAPNIISNLSKQLKLDISKVETDGAEKGTFPIPGTTWTIGF